jgi:hypothetical protein
VIVGGRNIPTFGSQYAKLSSYAKLRIQRYSMAQAAQKAISNSAVFSSSMFGAKIDQAQGLAELSVRIATERMTKAANAKRDALLKSLDVSV